MAASPAGLLLGHFNAWPSYFLDLFVLLTGCN